MFKFTNENTFWTKVQFRYPVETDDKNPQPKTQAVSFSAKFKRMPHSELQAFFAQEDKTEQEMLVFLDDIFVDFRGIDIGSDADETAAETKARLLEDSIVNVALYRAYIDAVLGGTQRADTAKKSQTR